MKKSCISILVFAFVLLCVSCSKNIQETDTSKIKVALRTVGHKLLLAKQDSTSLVLPVEKIDALTYNLTFERELSIEPDSLVSIVKNVFDSSNLPHNYIIEVQQCQDHEVAYSFIMKWENNTDIIPCKGRSLPSSCYIILVKFSEKPTELNLLIWLIPLLVLGILGYILIKKRSTKSSVTKTEEVPLGSYTFYPEQLKLVKHATEINLSKKECEILEVFVAQPNQVITREELSKKIWEDNGVIVGRSLDTYISKLRKKLQDDPKIKLSNVHGVGYKLEIE